MAIPGSPAKRSLKRRGPGREIADDEQGPAFTDDVEGGGETAVLTVARRVTHQITGYIFVKLEQDSVDNTVNHGVHESL